MPELDELPLTESTLFILLSLAPHRRHGYAILKDVGELSRGRVSLSTGTLYGALRRLVTQGWIDRCPDEQDGIRNRKSYSLAPRGRAILESEITRLRSLVELSDRCVQTPTTSAT